MALEKSPSAPNSMLPRSNTTAMAKAEPGALRNAPSAIEPTSDRNEPSGKAPNGAADSDKSNESSVCVNKMTHAVFSCEKANKCLGSNNFDGAYFKGLRAKLALRDSETMLICDEKSAESAPADDTPNQ